MTRYAALEFPVETAPASIAVAELRAAAGDDQNRLWRDQ